MSVVIGSTSGNVDDTGDNRKRRTRKRKSRTRTELLDAFSQHDEEEEEEKKEKSLIENNQASVGKKTEDGGAKANSSLTQTINTDEEDSTDKTKQKRKRKRSRGKGKKEEASIEATDSITGKDNEAAKALPMEQTSTTFHNNLEKLGDPHNLKGLLTEKTINALSYARLFHLARSEWKFSKAKQEYLIRHMLTPPSQSINDTVSKEQEDEKKSDNDDDEEAIDQQYWPDEWNQCVAKYLATIQGKAKDRLIEILTKAAEQVIPEVSEQVDTAPPSSNGIVPALLDAPTGKKTVSFGELALAQDEAMTNEVQFPSTNVSAVDVQKLQFRKDRATKLLFELQD